MTNLEIVLIIVVWIGYGLFAAYQTKDHIDVTYFLMALFSPFVIIGRAIYGAFKQYH